MRKTSSKEKIRQFLLANIGQVVSSIQIRDAAGTSVSEWARRVRELRDEEGWPIITHNDSAALKPGEYILTAKPPENPDIKLGKNDMIRNLTVRALLFIGHGGNLAEAVAYTTRRFHPALKRYYGRIIEREISEELGGCI